MGHRSTKDAVLHLERHGHLRRVSVEVDPYLTLAAIQRRLYQAGGPAVLFERVKGTPFPCVTNLFGTMARCHLLFADTYERVKKVVRLKADPSEAWRAPLTFASAPLTGLRSLPMRVRRGPCLESKTTIDQLPAIQSWPMDGGPFVTLPQVLTRDPDSESIMGSNVGMYRVQLTGNQYRTNEEIGLHFQIHRGIGPHYAKARDRGEPLRVSVMVGGPPAHTLAAVMPLPEGLSELLFAGMLGGRRFRYALVNGHVVSTDADFTIVGKVTPGRTLPEGPFGDHLGYYSLTHEFPVLEVEQVYHRKDAIWPFTVVGRPPQEDTSFGHMIHELTAPMVPKEIPGLRAMHAVDAAGVHPLLLALGSERYVPYEKRAPKEILTIANAVLGFGQASLAKYLIIAANEDDPTLDLHDIPRFFRHVLERIDLHRDLHFQTQTTMDTLDYTSEGLNTGSKVVIAAAGEPRRSLTTELGKTRFPSLLNEVRLVMPGVVAVAAGPHPSVGEGPSAEAVAASFEGAEGFDGLPLVVLVDDAEFTAMSFANFLWVTFTRSNPSHDIHGAGARFEHKHWGADGPLVIDARRKSFHAPPLEETKEAADAAEALAAPGGPLHGAY